ncbi:MAG TPA: hypothetical protein VIJ62_11640 [Rhizomicrobium sp.]
MPGKFSAYLTIYNDWEFLEQVLRSIAPYVDELIVADGAFEWMAPYLTAMGHDLERSDPRVYDIIEASRIPYRVVSGVWVNHIEKRLAAYRACTGRYACRIDSDEIMFFDDKELERFFRRGGVVGEVSMPTYIAPGWVKRQMWNPQGRRAKLRAFFRSPQAMLSRQSFLFDRTRVEPEIHLNYLWIVRDADKRPRGGEIPFAVYPRPVGFNAHLTIWRSIPASAQRAESYVLHHVLRNGVPWLPQLKEQPTDLKTLFEIVPPEIFREITLAARIGINTMLPGEFAMAPTPLTRDQEAIFAGRYKDLLAGHAALNRRMCDTGLHFARHMPTIIDLSDAACTDCVAPDGTLFIEFESDLRGADVKLRSVVSHAPWQTVTIPEHRREGRLLAIRLPPLSPGSLRREIEFKIETVSGQPIQRFRVRTGREELGNFFPRF